MSRYTHNRRAWAASWFNTRDPLTPKIETTHRYFPASVPVPRAWPPTRHRRPEAPCAHAGRPGNIPNPSNAPHTLARNRVVDETVRWGRFATRWPGFSPSRPFRSSPDLGRPRARVSPAITGVRDLCGRAIFANGPQAVYPRIGTPRCPGSPTPTLSHSRRPQTGERCVRAPDDRSDGTWASCGRGGRRDERGIAAGVAVTAPAGPAARAARPSAGPVRTQAVASERPGRRVAVSCGGGLAGCGAPLAGAWRA